MKQQSNQAAGLYGREEKVAKETSDGAVTARSAVMEKFLIGKSGELSYQIKKGTAELSRCGSL